MYVPAANARALAKASALDCDVLIFDLEDAVAPAMKEGARQNLVDLFSGARPTSQELVIRINGIGSADFALDLAALALCRPDAVLLPKVSAARDFDTLVAATLTHGVDPALRIWAMIESPAALVSLDEIARAGLQSTGRLDCLVVGTNDLSKDTGVFPGDGRAFLLPWLMNIVLVAKHHGLCVLDGVWNDFADMAGFEAEANQGVKMAFDGKTLIHPSQVAPANRAFSPSESAVHDARRVVAAFDRPEHAMAGVISLDGKMVERLHLAQALRLLSAHETIAAREKGAH